MRRMLIACVLAAASAFALVAVPSTASAQSADEILARFDDEPSVLEVQKAAMVYAGIDPELSEGWIGRANGANALPERVQYRFQYLDEERDLDQFSEDLNADGSTLGADSRREGRTEQEMRHQVTVQWDFSELVFNPDVLRAAREIGRQAKVREDILSTVTKLYYERRRAQIDMVTNPPGDASDRIQRELRIQELTADIDAMTGAWFSSKLMEAGKNPY